MDTPVRSHTRILALYAAASLAASLKDQAALILAQSNLSDYRSRGKGKGKVLQQSFASNTNRQSRSKYMPHVGAKEIAKHDAREKAAHRKFINSVEREIAVRKWRVLANV